MYTSRYAPRQRGLTLIELVLFIVIVSIAVVGVLQVITLTTRYSADPLRRKQALAIAESLLEEVEMAHFTFCDPTDTAHAETATAPSGCTVPEGVGPEAGNARPYDNVNDYVSAFNADQASFNNGGVLSDAALNPIPLAGYTAKLMIVPEALNDITSDATAAGMNVLRIRVAVDYGGDSVVLEGYRTRYAPNAVP